MKNQNGPPAHTIYKANSNGNWQNIVKQFFKKDLNVRSQAIQLLEENKGCMLFHTRPSDIFIYVLRQGIQKQK